MIKAKMYVRVLRSGVHIDLGDGELIFVTPEVVKDLAEKNGWRIEPIPTEPGELQALVELSISIPSSFGIDSSMEIKHA